MTTVRKTLDELTISNERLKELADRPEESIDYSDIPALDETFWRNAKVVPPANKERLTVRFDADLVNWFKQQGRGYQTRMNAVLRSYYEAHRKEAK
jgi:uncharacterized protein (DUF4415 family)